MHRSHAIGSVLLVVVALVGGCRQAPVPEIAAPAQSKPAVAAKSLALMAVSTDPDADRPAALLVFDRPLAQGQPFDDLLAITVKDGAAPEGSWALDDDGRRLRFPYLAANTQYVVSARAALAAADGTTLGQDATRELHTGPLEPLAGFASQGSVLPAHESRGLPVVTVNVAEVDVEFLRVRERALPAFLAEYQKGGRRSYWSLDELARHAEPVYANRFALESRPNERTVSYIPVRDLDALREPGLYFAVLKRPGTYAAQYDTAMFFVSDLGVHVRAYGSRMLVHVASLESGRPRAGVELSLRGKDAAVVASATTDESGLATLEAKPDPAQVLLASFGRDLSLLSFRQPALDLSEFAVAGRPWRAIEIFPWSGRDLYRPGETLRVSALLRDDDGKAVPGQPLVATLRQPDGRAVVQAQLEPGALGYYEWSREIARDAPTGRWSVDFASDPAQSDAAFAFRFRVEEFLPERLKLELAAEPQTLVPGDALPLAVDAAYLYGAPAAGNRFTAQLALALEQHPVASLPDFVFGDALVELPKAPQDVIDAVLDPQGRLRQDVALPDDSGKATPVRVVIAGSVYETGGRAVSRSLSRTIWPAPALVGVRPLFDLDDGAAPGGNAGFEVVRSDAAGTLLAAEGLKARLVREIRDWNWSWDDGEGWRTDYTQRFETLDERTLAIAAGGRAELSLPVDWGGYRLEIDDPSTGLTLRLPFQAGWSADDANRGVEARPDKVKLALDKAAYRGGDTLKVTLTPPHPGPALLLLEGDALLWHRTLDAKAGTVVEIPLDKSWERHDLYLSALVFRPGSESARVTPKRALGVVHVPIDRSERRIAATLAAPASMRPGNALEVDVSAPLLAGQVAAVRITAVDLGVLNITRFPLPDAADWFFAQRRLGVDARDLYARVIESLDGAKARLRYGGDAALLALPQARRPDAGVRTVDLYHAPVTLDAQGKARVSVPVPDFNGTLRVRALVYGEDRYGATERDTLVRAPLVAEASLPRVLAPGDRSQLTLDLTNLSDADGEFEVRLRAEGPLALERESARVALADGAKRTLDFGLRARRCLRQRGGGGAHQRSRRRPRAALPDRRAPALARGRALDRHGAGRTGTAGLRPRDARGAVSGIGVGTPDPGHLAAVALRPVRVRTARLPLRLPRADHQQGLGAGAARCRARGAPRAAGAGRRRTRRTLRGDHGPARGDAGRQRPLRDVARQRLDRDPTHALRGRPAARRARGRLQRARADARTRARAHRRGSPVGRQPALRVRPCRAPAPGRDGLRRLRAGARAARAGRQPARAVRQRTRRLRIRPAAGATGRRAHAHGRPGPRRAGGGRGLRQVVDAAGLARRLRQPAARPRRDAGDRATARSRAARSMRRRPPRSRANCSAATAANPASAGSRPRNTPRSCAWAPPCSTRRRAASPRPGRSPARARSAPARRWCRAPSIPPRSRPACA